MYCKGQNRYSRMKTLCTLDTSDIHIPFSLSKHDQSLNKANKPCRKKCSRSKIARQTYKSLKTQHSRTTTTKSLNKTDYKENRLKDFNLKSKKSLHNFVRIKLASPLNRQSTIQSYKVLKVLKCDRNETIRQIYYLDEKQNSYILKKALKGKYRRQYEHQLEFQQKLRSHHGKQYKQCRYMNLPLHQYVETNKLHLVYRGVQSFNWRSINVDGRVIEVKDIPVLLKHIGKAMKDLAMCGYVHGAICFENISWDAQNHRYMLSEFGHCFPIDRKEQFLRMKRQMSTPPEINNYQIFESGSSNYDRQMLQSISNYQHGIRIDIWALGILILEILHQGPLLKMNEQTTFTSLLTAQKHLLEGYSYLLESLDEPLGSLVKRMVSLDPQERPTPQSILRNV